MDITTTFYGNRTPRRGSAVLHVPPASRPSANDRRDSYITEARHILSTALRTQLVCGVLGLLFGAMVYGVLQSMGVLAVAMAPGATLFAIEFFATIFGFIVGGLLPASHDDPVRR